MASRNIFLTERGFGSASHGNATVICDQNGKPMSLRSVILPDKNIGGELVIVPLSERDNKRAKSHINNEEMVYEVAITRQTKGKESCGSIRIREIDANNLSVKIYQTCFVLNAEEVRFIDSVGMNESGKAKELLSDVLFDAFNAAYGRSRTSNPNGLFFGKMAEDVGPTVRQKYEKTKKETVCVTV